MAGMAGRHAGDGRTPGVSHPAMGAAADASSDSEDDYSDVSGGSNDIDEEDLSWIEWFCRIKGNEFFVEVDEEYIQDDFNLTGLSQQVPYFEHALRIVLDMDDEENEEENYRISADQRPLVEAAAQMLYGLVHARFILTNRGMAAMFDKYGLFTFGICPNAFCESQRVSLVPVGSDTLRESTAKVYCPLCCECYYPRSSRLDSLDGAYFGSSFAHMFFMNFPHLVPSVVPELYVPRIYGFKVSRVVKEELRRKASEQQQGSMANSTANVAAIADAQRTGQQQSGSIVARAQLPATSVPNM